MKLYLIAVGHKMPDWVEIGFKEYTKATLDAEIEHLTHAWWEEEAAGTGESALKTGRAIRMNTVVRLYRLRREPQHVGPPPVSRSVQPAP